jgi:protein-S-isoprenylcysteine O-methyltransferase Ste14
MTVYSRDQINDVGGALNELAARGWMHASYNFIFRLAYAVDLLFCVVGYLLTLRILDAHIRSTDATVLGWLTALVCYQPFYSVVGPLYLRYDDNRPWTEYFAPYPNLGGIWGFVILLLVILYSLSTVAFGLRFSNLTHRGIITGGPYRYFKHPAYLSKNLSWWMISVPFLSTQGGGTAFRHCVLLGLLNTVYFLRAKTEERHLSADPRYVAYSEWMRDHGAIAKLRRLILR